MIFYCYYLNIDNEFFFVIATNDQLNWMSQGLNPGNNVVIKN